MVAVDEKMTAVTGEEQVPDGALEEAVASLRVGGRHGPETRLLALGVLLLLGSVVLVFAGWWGASGTLVVGEQMPYLVSGGLAGVAVAVIGAALYVRHSLGRYLRYWLIRSVHEQRVQTDRLLEEQRAQVQRLAEALDRVARALEERDGPSGS